VKRVWETCFNGTKTLQEVQEFFLCIYPHTQCGGARRLVKVFLMGELATAGYPNGDAVESDGDYPDQDDAETRSSSTSHGAADNADGTVSETDSSIEASPLDDLDCNAAGRSKGSKQFVESNGRAVGAKVSAAETANRRGSNAQTGSRRSKKGLRSTSEGSRHLRGNRDSPSPSCGLGVGKRTSNKRKV